MDIKKNYKDIGLMDYKSGITNEDLDIGFNEMNNSEETIIDKNFSVIYEEDNIITIKDK